MPAGTAHMSACHFSREFRQHPGESPARAVERLRVEADERPIERIASKMDFANPERMRPAFLRTFGEPPQSRKRAARARRAADVALA